MRHPMTIEHKIKIKKNYVILVNEMQLEYMIPYFIQEGVLSYEQVDRIRSGVTSFSMNDRFLQILPYKGDRAYSTLISSLKLGSGQPHLADLLESTVVLDEDIVTLEAAAISSRYNSGYSSSQFDDYDSSPRYSKTTSRQASISSQRPANLSARPTKPEKNPQPQKKKRKQKRSSKAHTEQLQAVSYLFPYVVPHIHKKWRQLAAALNLEDKDLEHIVEIPHEKQSRYALMMLEAWYEKMKLKATKSKLTSALQDCGLKKALEAISIYNVPKFKAKPVNRKPSVGSSISDSYPDKTAANIEPYLIRDRKKKAVQDSRNLKRIGSKGYLPIKCQIERINSEDISESTQKAFISLADKITDTMIKNGERATEILNAMEKLKGIYFDRVYKGSIIIETTVQSLTALEKLMNMYQSKELAGILERVFVTPQLLAMYHASEVKLTTQIVDNDYEICRDDLMEYDSSCDADKPYGSDSCIDSPLDTTDGSDIDDYEVFEDKGLDQLISIRHHVHDAVCHLNVKLSANERQVSEFLMTLQLVQPLHLTKVRTISDLVAMRDTLEGNPTTSLSSSSINSFLQFHNIVKEEMQSLKTLVTEVSAPIKLTSIKSKEVRNLTKSEQKILSIEDKLIEIERMLSDSYDFSGHSHSRTVNLTTLESLFYQGLLSYHHVIVDKLFQLETF